MNRQSSLPTPRLQDAMVTYNVKDLGEVTLRDIDKQFREFARKLHPDRPGGNADMFRHVQLHYKVLNDFINFRDHNDHASIDDAEHQPLQHAVNQYKVERDEEEHRRREFAASMQWDSSQGVDMLNEMWERNQVTGILSAPGREAFLEQDAGKESSAAAAPPRVFCAANGTLDQDIAGAGAAPAPPSSSRSIILHTLEGFPQSSSLQFATLHGVEDETSDYTGSTPKNELQFVDLAYAYAQPPSLEVEAAQDYQEFMHRGNIELSQFVAERDQQTLAPLTAEEIEYENQQKRLERMREIEFMSRAFEHNQQLRQHSSLLKNSIHGLLKERGEQISGSAAARNYWH